MVESELYLGHVNKHFRMLSDADTDADTDQYAQFRILSDRTLHRTLTPICSVYTDRKG